MDGDSSSINRRANDEIKETRGCGDGEEKNLCEKNAAAEKKIKNISKGNPQDKQRKEESEGKKMQQIAEETDKTLGSTKLTAATPAPPCSSSSEDENEENDSLLKDQKKIKNTSGSNTNAVMTCEGSSGGASVTVRSNEMSTFDIEEANGSSHSPAALQQQRRHHSEHHRHHHQHSSSSSAARVRRLRWWISSSNTGEGVSTTVSSSGTGSPTTTVSAPGSTNVSTSSWRRNRKRTTWKWLVSRNIFLT